MLVAKGDHVYLTDFGLTKRVASDGEATKTGVVLGTLNYMAPEQIRGQAIGPFTDVYSLGCLVVHLLTGEVPFPVEADEAKLWAHVAEPPPRPSERVAALGDAFDPVVARAMRKRPEDRFATAGEVGAAMTAAAARAPAPAPAAAPAPAPAPAPAAPAPAPAPAPRLPTRRDVVLAAAREPFSLAVLGVLLVAAIALGQVTLGVPLALAIYAAAVLRSYNDPDTAAPADAVRLSAMSERHASTPAELKARIEAERRGACFLHYRDADGSQRIVELAPGDGPVTVGRRADNTVPLSWDAEVSRVHAQLEPVGRDWVLVDDGLSRNGTFVNGERAAGRRRLRDGDRICFGETVVRFQRPAGGGVALHRRRRRVRRAAQPDRDPAPAAGRAVPAAGGLPVRDARRPTARSPTSSTSPSTRSRRTCGSSSSGSGSTGCRRTRSARGWRRSRWSTGWCAGTTSDYAPRRWPRASSR